MMSVWRGAMQYLFVIILFMSSASAVSKENMGSKKKIAIPFLNVETSPDDELKDQIIEIFENNCAFVGCHAGTAGSQNLDLSEEFFISSLINVKSSDLPQFLRIKPGDAENSYLVKKIRGTSGIKGEKMPRGGAPLADVDIAIIENWINSLEGDIVIETPEMKNSQAFYGWTLANLPTTETLEKGAFLYRIAHRFRSPVSDGFDKLWGLDGGAFMMTQLAFPLANNLSVTVERSAENATFEFGGKWRFLRETKDASMPISAALYTGVDWATLKEIADPGDNQGGNLSRTDRERFSFFAQLPITKQINSNVSLAAVPGILLNGNVRESDEDPLVTLGFAGKFSFNHKYALFAEIVPILSGDENAATVGVIRTDTDKDIFNDAFTTGLEIKAGGHVFHIFVSNSAGNTTNQYMSGGNFDFLDGEYRLGFNIYRHLNYPFK